MPRMTSWEPGACAIENRSSTSASPRSEPAHDIQSSAEHDIYAKGMPYRARNIPLPTPGPF